MEVPCKELLKIYIQVVFRRHNTLEIEWNPQWFKMSKRLNTLEKERSFLIDLAKKFAIKESQDWKKVTHSMLFKSGGQVE